MCCCHNHYRRCHHHYRTPYIEREAFDLGLPVLTNETMNFNNQRRTGNNGLNNGYYQPNVSLFIIVNGIRNFCNF